MNALAGLKQKYPSIQRYFDIETEVKEACCNQKKTERDGSRNGSPGREREIVTAMKWCSKRRG